MKWKGKLIDEILKATSNDLEWHSILTNAIDNSATNIHLAIFTEPYLSLLLDGIKKVESRFSVKNVVPYGKVQKGDVIILKKSGGLICGLFVADDVQFFRKLDESHLELIKKKYSALICSHVEVDFWESRVNSRYLTLITVGKIKRISPIVSEKNDRTAWSLVSKSYNNTLFDSL